VLVVATRGEHGEVDAGFLDEGEELWQRRVIETHAAAAILGASRTEFLGYIDSGMMGEPTNELPGSFWTAPIEQAAERLAAILREEQADVLTIYDDFGNYGHPDHIQVHRVGVRAAELAGTPRVYQLTTSREHMQRGMAMFREQALAAGVEVPPEETQGEDGVDMGKPEAEITAAVDVSDYLDTKRAAMRAHASQIGEQSVFLSIPDEGFAFAFGTEWAIRAGQGPGITETDLMAGL
jgi:LmbE family N-acetylglucosaminyl deacetylase